MLVASVGSVAEGLVGLVFLLGFFTLVLGAAVWFFRGPAKAAEKYVDGLAMSFQTPQEASLFRQIYATKGPKSTVIAWLLSIFLSPTVSYIYQAKWTLAVVSFVTLQGFFIWYFVAIFTMPFEVVAANKKLADEAFQQVSLSRGFGGQQVVIHHAYPQSSVQQPTPGTNSADIAVVQPSSNTAASAAPEMHAGPDTSGRDLVDGQSA
jgi:hypothetical protein